MKVILNKDLAALGEEGDVKDVARGYARNYLFPREIALPYNEYTVKLFESKKDEIEAKKAAKRTDAASLKERLEGVELSVTMPAGANGKLYGAVTSQTIADELTRQGFQIERKRIELLGTGFKSVGKYKVIVKLYENASAELTLTVLGQQIKTETREQKSRRPGRRDVQAPPATNEGVSPGGAVPAGETESQTENPGEEQKAASSAEGGE
jgi:large subunit ribosomal protein L9